ncbi:MAG TPA: acyl-CoA dehydrogenase family protein [Chloroflexota bacterium]|nr:acyl-CoA dehydrogenase family protein [Chloroflexota bacterium]
MASPSVQAVIPVPYPSRTPEEMIRLASKMVPRLRERQGLCEQQGRLPDVSNDEFVDAGFYRILQPRRFGGYEFAMPTFMKVMMEVARGCPSSGWVLALTSGHAIMLSAFFSEEAQIDIYGDTGEFRGPSSTPPRVIATPATGGWRLTGNWDYASGIDISTHFIGGIGVPKDDGSVEPRMAILDRKDYEIVDNWHVVGMRGTGSRRVQVEDVFVPDFRTIIPPRDAFNARNAPGRKVHANPMYCAGRLTSVLLGEMAAVAVGAAKGMLDVYEEEVSPKGVRMAPGTRAQQPEFQRHYGQAWALIAMAEATVLKVAEDYMEFARQDVEDGVPFSDERDQQLQVLEQYATKLAGDAVDLLFQTGGTSSAHEGSYLQRYFRDMSVLRTHIAAQYERGAESLGRVHFTGQVAPVAALKISPV